jgi:hypothetical protein
MSDRTPQEGELILYRTANDAVRVEVLYESETFWLDQRRMAELFGIDVRTVSYHLKEVYTSGELTPEATLQRIWRVQREGNREVRRDIEWTHARHPYLSGDVSSVRIDAGVLGIVPLALHREDALHDAACLDADLDGRPVYWMAPVAPAGEDASADLLLQAQECIDARAYAEADELLQKVLAVDLRHLDAHALLGERNLSSWPTLALHHFELGVAIASLTVGQDFDGVLPWGFVDNRPFLRCLHGLARALLRRDRREDAAAALRRLLRLDPADHLGAREGLAAIEAGKTWREMETAP